MTGPPSLLDPLCSVNGRSGRSIRQCASGRRWIPTYPFPYAVSGEGGAILTERRGTLEVSCRGARHATQKSQMEGPVCVSFLGRRCGVPKYGKEGRRTVQAKQVQKRARDPGADNAATTIGDMGMMKDGFVDEQLCDEGVGAGRRPLRSRSS